MTETSLCPHDRLTSAYCPDCALEAEIYQPAPIDWDDVTLDDLVYTAGSEDCGIFPPETPVTITDCVHGIRIDRYCPMCATEQNHAGGSSAYYDLPPGVSRLHDIIRDKGMTWNQANIFKAAYRWDIKPDLNYNLRKMLWYVNDEINEQKKRGLWDDAKNAVFPNP